MGKAYLGKKFSPEARKKMSLAHKQDIPEEVMKLSRRARRIVQTAIKNGELIKNFCVKFGRGCEGRLEAHHPDYSKPLKVKWYCRTHHLRLHHALWKH